MAIKIILLYVWLLTLLFNATETKGQLNPPDLAGWLKPEVVADIDTNTSFDKISFSDYLKWIDKLIFVDQKYRLQERGISSESDPIGYKKVWKRIKINDQANEIVLLKLLEKFGWPCTKKIDHSYKAWIVVWHSNYLTFENGIGHETFVPFIRRAYQNGCMEKTFYLEVMKTMKLSP